MIPFVAVSWEGDLDPNWIRIRIKESVSATVAQNMSRLNGKPGKSF
jgi:hypothetical protein